jgi:hypothetical protein
MKGMIIRSALVLGLGVASSAVLAQTETVQPTPKPEAGATTGQSATGGQQIQGQAEGTMKQDAQGSAEAGARNDANAASEAQGQGGATAGTETRKQPSAADAGQGKKSDAGKTAGMKKQPASDDTAAGQEQGESGTTTGMKADRQPGAQEGGTTAGSGEQQPSGQAAQDSGGVSGETTASVNVTTEQQTEIRQIITEEKVQPVPKVDFEVTVGTAVPNTIEVHRLPPRIVELVPAYEGYMYFVLADGRIVIVEPDTMQIVYVLTA